MTPFLRARFVFALGGSIAGCTALVGVEDEYSPRHEADVLASGGTQSATGGSSGGSIEAGAATGGGGSGGSVSCGSGRKVCAGECQLPDPSIGCALQGCDPCPGAAHAEPVCNGYQCAQQCTSGFEWNGAECVASGSGGSGGAGGAGGVGGVGGAGGVGGVGGVSGTGGSGGGVSGSGGTGGRSTCDTLVCGPNQPCAACPPCPIAPFSNCCLPGGTCGGMWVTGCFPCGP